MITLKHNNIVKYYISTEQKGAYHMKTKFTIRNSVIFVDETVITTASRSERQVK
jgi:hypothetical protein